MRRTITEEEELKLQKQTNLFAHFSEETWEDFRQIWSPFEAARKSILTASGEQEQYLYFVLDGVQRIYYYDEQEREATILFVYAPSFGGVLDSFLLKTPSRYYYETLTKSTFLRTSVTQLNEVAEKHKEIQDFIQKGLLFSLSGVLERLVELQCFSSEEKFKVLLKRSPHLLKLVPQKYLANYIGIDPTNFSKLMNKVVL